MPIARIGGTDAAKNNFYDRGWLSYRLRLFCSYRRKLLRSSLLRLHSFSKSQRSNSVDLHYHIAPSILRLEASLQLASRQGPSSVTLMPERNYKNWLQAYMNYTQHSEAPELFHFWTAVSMIGGALRRQVWIEERTFQWTPNFYIVLVAPAGVATKSTTVRIGTKLLEQVEGVNFGPQSMTWQALTQSLAKAKQDVPFGEAKFLPMSCITCAIMELGTFLKPDDGELIDVLVSLWDGQLETWRKETKTQGKDEIVNPWVNVIGCTTPAWLRANMPETMIGGGLTSRILFVYGDKKRHYIPYPGLVITEKDYLDTQQLLVQDLQKIGQLKGEYELTQEAIAWGSVWYENHWNIVPEHLASERFEGYRARKQTHVHKVAIVLAAARSDELIIEEQDLVNAYNLVTGTEADMLRVFESIGLQSSAQRHNEVLAYVRAYGKIDDKTLWNLCLRIMERKQYDEALEGLVLAGQIQRTLQGQTRVYVPVKQKKKETKEKEEPSTASEGPARQSPPHAPQQSQEPPGTND